MESVFDIIGQTGGEKIKISGFGIFVVKKKSRRAEIPNR